MKSPTAAPPSAFGTESPARRYFIGGAPISWCYDESARALYRYQGYGLAAQQPAFGSAVLATATSAELMAENLYNDLGSNEFPFYVFEATLERNSLIQIDWRFRRHRRFFSQLSTY